MSRPWVEPRPRKECELRAVGHGSRRVRQKRTSALEPCEVGGRARPLSGLRLADHSNDGPAGPGLTRERDDVELNLRAVWGIRDRGLANLGDRAADGGGRREPSCPLTGKVLEVGAEDRGCERRRGVDPRLPRLSLLEKSGTRAGNQVLESHDGIRDFEHWMTFAQGVVVPAEQFGAFEQAQRMA